MISAMPDENTSGFSRLRISLPALSKGQFGHLANARNFAAGKVGV